MNKSASLSNLAAALVLAQSQVETAKMDTVNPFFKSKYADLGSVWDAVRGALQANGLAVTQFPDVLDANPALTTMLVHKSGEWLEATYPLVVTKGDPQSYGSALTYARRYGLSAVLGVVADDDDDGNHASKPARTQSASVAPKPAPAGPSEAAPKSPATGAPKVSAAEWAMSAIAIIRKSSFEELQAWEALNAKAMEKLHGSNAELWQDVTDNIVARRSAIGTA